jgi:hypothetical protein
MKKILNIAGIFLLIVGISNYIPPIKGLLEFGTTYTYTTLHGRLQPWEMPGKQPDFQGAMRRFERYKQENPQSADTILYRTFRRNPLIVWRWHDYFFHPRYKLPYLNPQHTQG